MEALLAKHRMAFKEDVRCLWWVPCGYPSDFDEFGEFGVSVVGGFCVGCWLGVPWPSMAFVQVRKVFGDWLCIGLGS
jgi:hypothetical protein